jgi:hypothetical protein
MKRLPILLIFIVAGFVSVLQGCQSQKDEASKEKEKNFWDDASPEKYKSMQEKPEKPYWDKTK